VRRVNLALQGGGAHGAFTWGVLDRLLEEEDLEFAGISGTSAGALNGAALKAGLIAGGRVAAQKRLDRLWDQIGATGDFRMVPWLQPFLPAMRFWQTTTAAMLPFSPQGLAAQMYSPYAWGDSWQNPLEPIVRDLDFSVVCAEAGPKLFVSATNVRTGKIKVFSGAAITPEALLASACLPTVFQTVEIDGEAYWDGGYLGNPSLLPLISESPAHDLVLVQINPSRREALPTTAADIINRLNEITFNASLLAELRAIEFVRRLLAEGKLDPRRYKNVRMHRIDGGTPLQGQGFASKSRADAAFLHKLFDLGREAGQQWLLAHRADVGVRATLDLAQHA